MLGEEVLDNGKPIHWEILAVISYLKIDYEGEQIDGDSRGKGHDEFR